MSDRVLTTRHLNRALLARQLLVERSPIPISDAVEQVGGLQTQYAPSGYVGLWTRLAGFARDDLTRALEDRSVVQATLMRVTIHVVSAAEYWRYTEGVREARRAWLERVDRNMDRPGMDEAARACARPWPMVRVMRATSAASDRDSSAGSASGSTSSASRRQARGNVDGPTGWHSRISGWARATARSPRVRPTSSEPTCAPSGQRPGAISRPGPVSASRT